MTHNIDDSTYQRYLAALLAANRAECTKIVQELIASGVDLKDLYVNLFQRSLYQVGELWEHQRISVAVSHLATTIAMRMLTLVQAQVLGGGSPGSVHYCRLRRR